MYKKKGRETAIGKKTEIRETEFGLKPYPYVKHKRTTETTTNYRIPQESDPKRPDTKGGKPSSHHRLPRPHLHRPHWHRPHIRKVHK